MLHQRAAHRPCGTAPSRRINTQLRALGQAGKGGKDLQERGKAWLSTILTRFGPATDRATNITTLEFEKPLLELDKRIKEVGGRAQFDARWRYIATARCPARCSLCLTGPQGGRGERGGRQRIYRRAGDARAAGGLARSLSAAPDAHKL
jgi:hypothetical protein